MSLSVSRPNSSRRSHSVPPLSLSDLFVSDAPFSMFTRHATSRNSLTHSNHPPRTIQSRNPEISDSDNSTSSLNSSNSPRWHRPIPRYSRSHSRPPLRQSPQRRSRRRSHPSSQSISPRRRPRSPTRVDLRRMAAHFIRFGSPPNYDSIPCRHCPLCRASVPSSPISYRLPNCRRCPLCSPR